jgi:ABC-type transporter Mla MlaB component
MDAVQTVNIQHRGDGLFALLGAVEFDNAGQLMTEGQRLFADHDSIVVDTSAAQVSSAAGLAVMMKWASWCGIRDIGIVFEGVHANALAVAELNGVTMMLPVADRVS